MDTREMAVSQRRNARVNRVTFNGLNILVLGS